MSSLFDRVVVLIDMDCFYVQVEQRRDPSLKGKPCAVVQYKDWKGGGIIAVGYEARAKGVSRGMRGDYAKEKCPDIVLCKVPEAHGKANLDRYRDAGAEVINVLSKSEGRVERASIDEAYIDLTHIVDRIQREKKQKQSIDFNNLPNTHVVGWPKDTAPSEDKFDLQKRGLTNWLHQTEIDNNELDERLAIAATITEELRASVYHQTGFRCSAGISHNKMLAKLACGINKPNKQTVLPRASVHDLFETVKIGKIRNLGGKLGHLLSETFNVQFIGQVGKISKEMLADAVGEKNTTWLKEISRGIDHELVKIRHVAQSIGCGKNFPGMEALNTKENVRNWIQKFVIELSERLEKDKSANNRIARTLSVHVKQDTGQSLSRSGPLLKYGMESLAKQCYQLIHLLNVGSSDKEDPRWFPSIVSMHVNAKKFDPCGRGFISQTSKNLSPTKLEQVRNNSGFKTIGSTSNSIVNASHDEEFNCYQDRPTVAPLIENNKSINNTSPTSTELKIQKVITDTPVMAKTPKTPDPCGRVDSQSSFRPSQNSLVKSFFRSLKRNSPSAQSTANVTCDSIASKNVFCPNNEETSGKNLQVNHGKVDMSKKLDETVTHVLRTSGETPDMHSNISEATVSNSAVTDLPKTSGIVHPDYGTIDMKVFGNLPDDIKREIMTSYKISKSQITVGPRENNMCKDLRLKNGTKNQKTLFNFLPPSSRQGNVSRLENLEASFPTGCTHGKRAGSDVSFGSSKKAKTLVTGGSSKKSSGKKKAKVRSLPKFASPPKDNVVPLGFFRQRLVLSSAISKAVAKTTTSDQKTA